MDTEHEKHESNDPAVNVESEPMSISDDSNEFSTALQELKALACQNSFTSHDVPYDGNCRRGFCTLVLFILKVI